MDSSSITSLANVRLSSKSRLLRTACCPDKDLVLLISRAGNADKLSLWKMQGSKRWEVEVDSNSGNGEEVTALAWSPDGQTFVVAHHPPRITLHSIHTGREERSLSIDVPTSESIVPPRITGLWWFKKEQKIDKNQLPDLFHRGNVITGSALSILRTQPLLDPLQDETLPLNAADLFAFQGSQSRPASKITAQPEVILSWPALPSDLLAASIKPSPRAGDNRPGEELDEQDRTNVDSLLVASDNAGRIHCFLDGSYPLGAVTLAPSCETTSLLKCNEDNTLYAHAGFKLRDGKENNNLIPLSIDLPLLGAKTTRQIAESCSAARELLWYIMRVVREMRKAWFGGDGQDGAREMNANYIRGLESRQAQFAQEQNAVFDLTCLLTTGRSSPALSDFNQTYEQTNERGLQRWESTVGEALLRLRDYSEKRVAPACQRLHLILEEVLGWSLLPQLYGDYGFSTEDVKACMDLAARGIILSAWLAATARRELFRFTEFMSFLRYETSRFNTSERENNHVARHDILEVNEYLMSGLVVSSIDKWFLGPVPQFSPERIGTPETGDLRATIDQARQFLADPSKSLVTQQITSNKDLSHLDRNLDALVHALAERCQRVFDRAARAVARTAKPGSVPDRQLEEEELETTSSNSSESSGELVRTRAVCADEPGKVTVHQAIRLRSGHEHPVCRELLCIIRTSYHRHEGDSRPPLEIEVAVLECKAESGAKPDVPEEEKYAEFQILDMDFFDGESLVVVCRPYAPEGSDVIALVDYAEVEYQKADVSGYVKAPPRQDIVAQTVKRVERGEITSAATPIRKERELKLSRTEEGLGVSLTLCVNGRAGRRVACVLDAEGMELEMFDMEGDGEDEEGETS